MRMSGVLWAVLLPLLVVTTAAEAGPPAYQFLPDLAYAPDTKGGADAQTLAQRWTPHGYVIAAVNTRSSSQALFPAQLHDIKAAIRWLRKNAHHYRIDPDHIGIMGNSSGGWTAAMAGTTCGVGELEGDVGETGYSSCVQAVVDLYGATDFLEMDPQACRSNRGCVSVIEHDAAGHISATSAPRTAGSCSR